MSPLSQHREAETRLIGRIRPARLMRGLSQTQLAAAVGVRRHVIAALEGGARHLNFAEAHAIAQALGFTVADLTSPEPLRITVEVAP